MYSLSTGYKLVMPLSKISHDVNLYSKVQFIPNIYHFILLCVLLYRHDVTHMIDKIDPVYEMKTSNGCLSTWFNIESEPNLSRCLCQYDFLVFPLRSRSYL